MKDEKDKRFPAIFLRKARNKLRERLLFRAISRVSWAIIFLFLLAFSAHAQAPAWWYARGAVDPSLPAHDYSPVTLGQLKWIAAKAAEEMNAYFGAGPNVMAVVNAFVDSGNYIVATVGQVKYVAKPFYDRLYQLELIRTLPPGMSGHYPWPQYSSGGDYDLATIGQVKYVFSFDSAKDSDGDGFSDWQEEALRHGATISGNVIYSGPQVGQIYVVLAVNADGSRIEQRQILNQPGAFAFNEVPAWRTYWIKAWRDSNGNSYRDFWEAQGDSVLNPIYLSANVANANITLSDPDTDNDTLPDWWEVMWFGSLAQGPNDDPDRDLISNQQEQHFDMDPTIVTVTFGNATAIDNQNGLRIADTTMFFPNDGYPNDISKRPGSYDEDGTFENSIDDTKYASSFYLFARPNPRDDAARVPENEYQPVGPFDTYGSYQYNYSQWFTHVTEGAFAQGQWRSIFFEVDVLYNDFTWKDDHLPSSLTLDPDFYHRTTTERFLSEGLLKALKGEKILPVIVLLNGPSPYYAQDNMIDPIVAHAQRFMDLVYSWGVPAAYVLGCETPGSGFDVGRAQLLINRINAAHPNISPDDIPIGVHTQGKRDNPGKLEFGWPGNAKFLAYEFSWDPWTGFSHGAGIVPTERQDPDKFIAELREQNPLLYSFGVEAWNVAQNYGNPGVHFLEYNVRVSDKPETASYNQTLLLKLMFPYVSSPYYGNCFGFSRSFW